VERCGPNSTATKSHSKESNKCKNGPLLPAVSSKWRNHTKFGIAADLPKEISKTGTILLQMIDENIMHVKADLIPNTLNNALPLTSLLLVSFSRRPCSASGLVQ
jgi:hypothetical protein